MTTEASPVLMPSLLREWHRVDPWRNGVRLAVFTLLYFGAAAGAICIAGADLPIWRYALNLPLYLLAAASLHGISLFTHEAVHGTLSRHRWLNALLGSACALPVLQNYSAYRVLHLRHHQHLGDEGDPDHYANYTRWTWLIFGMNWGRLLIGYPVYITAIPILGLRHGSTSARIGILAEVGATLLLAWAVWASPLPASWIVHGWLLPMLVINTFVNIRGMSQHTLLPESNDEIRGTRSIITSPLIRFFMCNENFHLEHHLYPGVPWHHLPDVHAALKDELVKKGAPYIPTYGSFVAEFVRGSWERSPMGERRLR